MVPSCNCFAIGGRTATKIMGSYLSETKKLEEKNRPYVHTELYESIFCYFFPNFYNSSTGSFLCHLYLRVYILYMLCLEIGWRRKNVTVVLTEYIYIYIYIFTAHKPDPINKYLPRL